MSKSFKDYCLKKQNLYCLKQILGNGHPFTRTEFFDAKSILHNELSWGKISPQVNMGMGKKTDSLLPPLKRTLCINIWNDYIQYRDVAVILFYV